MALIDTYEKQLAMYEEAEERIVTGGQSFSDDSGTLKEANLKTITEEKKRLTRLINQIKNPRPATRSYKVEICD